MNDCIKEHGVIQPLLVSNGLMVGEYTLVAGERRLQASKMAGLETVPVILRRTTDQELLELAIIENVQRTDLSPLESAEAYRQLSEIFNLLHEYKMKVNLIQNSAISFSVCLEDKHEKFDGLLDELKDKFKIDFHKEVTLYTIRHFTEEAIKKIEKGNKLLLKQLTQETVQIVIE